MRTSLGVKLAMVAVVWLAPAVAWGEDYFHPRIVRLSFVEGTVAIQRPDFPQWAVAPVNTPIQQGFKLYTAENSFGEVEFEDASTIRIGQLTQIDFNHLSLASSGAKLNRMTLHHGYATFHILAEAADLYEVTSADRALTVAGRNKSMFRIDLEGGAMRVEVIQGLVDVSSIFGAHTLAQNKILELRPGVKPPEKEIEGITRDAWDEWVQLREKQTVPLQSRRAPGIYSNDARDLLYGWNDLGNYGTWSYVPGVGQTAWVPHVPSGWAPYRIGRWCWYPGIGYTWISGEPWGWLPYHYGEWAFQPGVGWCWIPPGSYSNWSPARVDWYQGQGWIGWGPHAPAVAGVVQRTRTFVTINTFANGNPISPADFIAVPPSQLTQVSTPQLAPAWTAALPGPTLPQLSQSSPVQAGASAEPAGNLRGLIGSSGGAAPAPTVVFDPADGRFVNNPAAEGRSIAPSAPTDAMRRPAPRSVWGASDVQGGTEPLRDSAGPERMTIRTRRPIPSAAAPDFTRDTHSVPETNPATSPAAAPAHGTTPNSSAWGTSSSSASAAAPPSSAPATPAGGSGATSHGGAFGAAPARETPNDASGAKGQGPARNE